MHEVSGTNAFDMSFDLQLAVLQIGRFVGQSEVGECVAGNLPPQLVRLLGQTGFYSVMARTTAHAPVMSGVVTHAGVQSASENDAATQAEAILTRDGLPGR